MTTDTGALADLIARVKELEAACFEADGKISDLQARAEAAEAKLKGGNDGRV